MLQRKIVIAIVILIVLLIISSNYFYSRNNQNTFRIGAFLYLTGDLAEAAEAFGDGIVLAADEVNAQGGIGKKKIELIVEDDQLKAVNSLTIAQKLVSVDMIDSVITGSFLEAQATSNVFEQAHTPLVILWDSNPQIDSMGDYIFAIGPWTPSASEASADFSYYNLSAKTAVIINNLEPWSSEVSSLFEKRFEELGGTILDKFPVSSEETKDFRTVIAKAISRNPDVIYSPLSEGMSTFYIQLKESGYKGNVVTSDIITENIIQATKGATEGIYQTQIMDPESKKTQHMIDLYKKKFGKEPKHVLYTAWGYDAVHIIAEASKDCRAEDEELRICIKNNFYKIKNFSGASATITINENGSSPMMESIFLIRNGSFVLIKK
jgi:branched-chain amino acid transport system substrate-binding protein